MKRSLPLLLISLLFVSAVQAFDKAALAQHLREALGLDSRTPITIVSEPTPSGVGNLLLVQANIGGGSYPVFLSPDNKKYLWGQMMDLTESPDAKNMRMMSDKVGHAQGSKTAPVTVVEYSDMECGFCKKAHEIIKAELYKNYTRDQVRLVYKHFPLNGHAWAEKAAVATECAAEQKEEAFWAMQDLIFKNAPSISTANISGRLAEFVAKTNLNSSAFNACMDNPQILQRVQDSKKEGMALGVNSTPTMFVNGRTRRGFREFKDLQVVIDEKLKSKK